MSVPIFVQIEHEAKVLDRVDELKADLLKAKKILHDIYELRAKENAQLHDVKGRIEQASKRIDVVGEVLSNE